MKRKVETTLLALDRFSEGKLERREIGKAHDLSFIDHLEMIRGGLKLFQHKLQTSNYRCP